MNRAFYNAVHGTSNAIKNTFKAVSGVSRLERRGLRITNDNVLVAMTIFAGGGIMIGSVAAASPLIGFPRGEHLAIASALFSGISLAISQLHTAYKAGQYDDKTEANHLNQQIGARNALSLK